MATARKCDRCKTYHDGRINRVEVHKPMGLITDDLEYDLCVYCLEEFDEFMNGVKPETLLDRLKSINKKGRN